MTRLSAGGYLRLRRHAAGLTVAEAARLYVHSTLASTSVELLLQEAEADLVRLGDSTLARLRLVFPFDPEIYHDFAEDFEAPICTMCGCSEHDACEDGCAWADASETLCTSCAPTRASRAPAAEGLQA